MLEYELAFNTPGTELLVGEEKLNFFLKKNLILT